MAKRDVTFGLETTLNKSNIIKSSSFHMDEGDILHIIYRDHSGALVTIALVNSEGEVEITQVIPTTTPAPTTTIATTTIATTTLTTTTPTTTPTTTFTTTTTVEPDEFILYGALYNWYAATDARNICSVGWHIPTYTEAVSTLVTFLGNAPLAGGKLKEIGLIYWNTPNTGASNLALFNGRGAGTRDYSTGAFSLLNQQLSFWLDPPLGAFVLSMFYLSYDSESSGDNSSANNLRKRQGRSIRPIKDSTLLTNGQTGTYTDPSGITYGTICIGTQEWVSENIVTGHYRNGDPIPNVTGDAAWAALTTGARCSYGNDESNAFGEVEIPEGGSTTADSTTTTSDSSIITADGS